MVGLTASALLGVMNPVLIKLTVLLGKEFEKFKDVRKKIADLQDELGSMKTALEMVSESEEAKPQVKEWMSQLRELSYDAEDCIDKYMHNLSHGDTSDGLTHKLTGLVTTLRARRRISNEIKELMERALKVSDRHRRYEQGPSMPCPNSVVIDPRLHAVFEEADRLVGIDRQRDKLVTWLTDRIDLHPQRMVVSIVGPGGLGKTTLANQVFQKITSQFDCTAFVSVSRSPNVKKILSDAFLQVLESYRNKTAEQSEEIARIQDLGHGGLDYLQLISRMRCYLQNKRYAKMQVVSVLCFPPLLLIQNIGVSLYFAYFFWEETFEVEIWLLR